MSRVMKGRSRILVAVMTAVWTTLAKLYALTATKQGDELNQLMKSPLRRRTFRLGM
jgi:hypothetical protein